MSGLGAKLGWYWNRLRLMSLAEILYRVEGQQLIAHRKRTLLKTQAQRHRFQKLGNWPWAMTDVSGFCDYYQRHPSQKDRLLSWAEDVLNHRLTFFNLERYPVDGMLNWHCDYQTGKVSPLVFYGDLNYRDYETVGDIKYVWELNRFGHFYPLVAAYLLTNDERYAREMVSQLEDWVDKNPCWMGINWTSNLELAIRVMTWSWALTALKARFYPVTEAWWEKIATSIYHHAETMMGHVSKHSSANNHLIGEAAGLLVAGCVFDFGSASAAWRQKGLDILLTELGQQFYADGMNKEQAMAYHGFSLEFFWVAFHVAESNGLMIPEEAWQRMLHAASAYRYWLMDENSPLPNIGDQDDGYVIALPRHNPEEAIRFSLQLAAVKSGGGVFKGLAGVMLHERVLWLMGPEAAMQYEQIEPAHNNVKSQLLKESGYALFRSDSVMAWMDVGPMGYLSIAAHGHADALSFGLNYQNKPFLMDTGTYAYHTQKVWREYFRGTSAHNTVEVDGLNQGTSGGNFMWLVKPQVEVYQAQFEGPHQQVQAWHDGYLQQGLGVRHRRQVHYLENQGFIILDCLTAQDPSHRYKLHWHLDPACSATSENGRWFIQHGEDALHLQVMSSDNIDVACVSGQENPPLGWVSPGYDRKVPTTTLQAEVQAKTSETVLVTLIALGVSPVWSWQQEQDKVKINTPDATWVVDLKSGQCHQQPVLVC